jgi:hypothetical protein
MSLLHGCLVLSDPDFRGQDECLPSFETVDASPAVGTVFVLGSGSTEFRPSVPVRSCALIKAYYAHVFVDGLIRTQLEIVPSGGEVRTFTALVDLSDVDPGCHTVEVLVSSGFAPTSLRNPLRPGDLAYVAWSVATSADVPVASCRTASR